MIKKAQQTSFVFVSMIILKLAIYSYGDFLLSSYAFQDFSNMSDFLSDSFDVFDLTIHLYLISFFSLSDFEATRKAWSVDGVFVVGAWITESNAKHGKDVIKCQWYEVNI